MRRAAVSMHHLFVILCISNKTLLTCDIFVTGRLSRDLVQSLKKKTADDERRVKHGGHHVPSAPNPLFSSKGNGFSLFNLLHVQFCTSESFPSTPLLLI